MVEMEITRMSSKGQVVIPSNFRKHIKEGDTLIVLKNNINILELDFNSIEFKNEFKTYNSAMDNSSLD